MSWEVFLCGAFVDSVREGIDGAWLSLSESEGNEAALRKFFRRNVRLPSCNMNYSLECGIQDGGGS